jgi:hypothetical protein
MADPGRPRERRSAAEFCESDRGENPLTSINLTPLHFSGECVF